jgi:hypothetical protein
MPIVDVDVDDFDDMMNTMMPMRNATTTTTTTTMALNYANVLKHRQTTKNKKVIIVFLSEHTK